MLRIALIFHLFIGTTLAGVAMVAALTMGYDTLQPVLLSALVGFLLSIPVTWYVAKAVYENN